MKHIQLSLTAIYRVLTDKFSPKLKLQLFFRKKVSNKSDRPLYVWLVQ